MADCPYVDQGKSGPSNGWYCIKAGSYVDASLYKNYCNGSSQNCPYLGGGLTTEICSGILSAAKTLANQIDYNVQYYFSYIAAEIERTGYEPLFGLYGQFVEDIMELGYDFEFRGTYSGLVANVPAQISLAEQLESDLNACFYGVGDASALFLRCGAELDIDTEAFKRISDLLSEFSSSSVYTVAYGDVVSKEYQGPLEDAAAAYSDMCYNTCYRYAESLYNIESKFDTGVEDTVSRAKEFGGGEIDTGRLQWDL